MLNNYNLYVVFYKGLEDFYGKIVRLWTFSPYSHSFLVLEKNNNFTAFEANSNYNKVRSFNFNISYLEKNSSFYKNYDYFKFKLNSNQFKNISNFLVQQLDKKYDWLGIFLSQIIPMNIEEKEKWFCSELCAYVISKYLFNLKYLPQKYSPGKLYKELKTIKNI